MTHISAYEHELAKFYHDAVLRIPGVRVWGPDFADGRARAPTVSITIAKITAAAAATALGNQGICVWDGDFYAARPVQVLGSRRARRAAPHRHLHCTTPAPSCNAC